MVSSRFEEQLQHCMELKKELTRSCSLSPGRRMCQTMGCLCRMREELDAGRKEEQLGSTGTRKARQAMSRHKQVPLVSRTKHREAEREWRQRVEELKSGLATARDTIQAQKIQIATMTLGLKPWLSLTAYALVQDLAEDISAGAKCTC